MKWLFQNDFIKATSQVQMNAVLLVLSIHKSYLKIIGMDFTYSVVQSQDHEK